MTADELAHALGKARRHGQGWQCLCPAHDDHEPSLSIACKDGKPLFVCRAGCDQDEVVSALRSRGLWNVETAAPPRRSRGIAAEYNYRDQNGELRYQVVRTDPKGFYQRRPNGAPDHFVNNMHGVEPLPYRLPELLGDPGAVIYVPEGEKDCDALGELGFVATTNHGGAGKWSTKISRWLRDRAVVILPDNDDAGRAHARDVASKLKGIAASVRIVELPGLPAKGDVSDWIAAGGAAEDLERLTALAVGAPIDLRYLSGTAWLTRDIPEPDFMLGEMPSTTTRMELIGPTGIGKSNFLLATAFAAAAGRGFLHWRGGGIPRRVLYVDGEMSRRLAKRRLTDATRRHGGMPATFSYLNREDFPDIEPLNTEAGQRFIDQTISNLGGVDFVVFDNIQALLTHDDSFGAESWEQALPWVRDLTRRCIGQTWAHHTGQDETRGYGSKTREWQLDTVALMEQIERPGADIAFSLKFTKARERAPENRADFDAAAITLANDEWSSERGGGVSGKLPARERVLELLADEIVRNGTIPSATARIPPNVPCITEDVWRARCAAGCISEGDEEATARAFRRSAKALLDTGRIGKHKPWVWIVR
jgi:hypothetical protein